MSFQSLPKELKHHIVDMCQAADIRRKERFHYSNKAKLRFEALGALSLVNRELRAMTVEYVADVSFPPKASVHQGTDNFALVPRHFG